MGYVDYFLLMVLIWVSIQDIQTHAISNIATFGVMGVGVLYNSYQHGWQGFWFSIIGIVGMFGWLLILHKLANVGEGDIKLFMAIGSVLGAIGGFIVYIYTSILLLVYTLPILFKWMKKRPIPLAPFTLFGAILYYIFQHFEIFALVK